MRDTGYEQELSRHIRHMVVMLDSYREDLPDWSGKDQLGAERALQVLIESVIGLSRYVVKIAFGITTARSRDAIDELRSLDVFSRDVHTRLLKIIGFRNVLVHDYLAVNDDVILSVLEKREYEFIEEVRDLLFEVLANCGQ